MSKRRGGRRRRYEWNPIWRRGAAAAAAGGGSDPDFANVSLLLPFNGTDGDTTTTDLSNSGHSVLFLSTPSCQLDDAQKKFGTTSLSVTPLDDGVTVADHADFEFGAGDFTIELHVRYDVFTGYLITKLYNSGTYSWSLRYDFTGNQWEFRYSTTGTTWTTVTFADAGAEVTGAWMHVVVCRDGTNLRLFRDGVQYGATHDIATSSIFDGTAKLAISGYYSGNDSYVNNGHDGHIDNVRITKGVARYTANFTAPTAEYPTS